jgi:polyhydroxyalkanoate synthesis repressor PhaR
MIQSAATDVIRIRKYPNRRLYDTSRSTHLTHDEVLAIVRRGNRVQISDSRSEADITNEVLLQILVARDPALVSALPTAALLAVARATPEAVTAASGPFGDLCDALRPAPASGATAATTSTTSTTSTSAPALAARAR